MRSGFAEHVLDMLRRRFARHDELRGSQEIWSQAPAHVHAPGPRRGFGVEKAGGSGYLGLRRWRRPACRGNSPGGALRLAENAFSREVL
jgi:hypothetical protein